MIRRKAASLHCDRADARQRVEAGFAACIVGCRTYFVGTNEEVSPCCPGSPSPPPWCWPALSAFAETQELDAGGIAVNAETIADGLQHPWGLEFLPDGGVIVTERPGRMRLVVDGKVSEPVAGVPEVAARGQGGLLDVTIAPDFAETGTIFFTYFEPGKGGAGIALARARLVRDAGTAHLDDLKVIFSGGQEDRAARIISARASSSCRTGR